MENPVFDFPRESFGEENLESESVVGESETEGNSTSSSTGTGGESSGFATLFGSDESGGPSDSSSSSASASNGEAESTTTDSEETADVLGTDGSTDGQTSTGSDDETSTSNDTGTEPDVLAYCEKGALSCYTFDEISSNQIVDHGPLNEPLTLDPGASLGDLGVEVDFLNSTLLASSSRRITRNTHAWPFLNGIVGVDVWLNVKNTSPTAFTLLQIGQYLRLSYDGRDKMMCSTWESGTKVLAYIPIRFDPSGLHHVLCAYDGEKLFVGASGTSETRVAAPAQESEAKIWIAENPPDAQSAPFVGQLAALRIWDSFDDMLQTIALEDAEISENGF